MTEPSATDPTQLTDEELYALIREHGETYTYGSSSNPTLGTELRRRNAFLEGIHEALKESRAADQASAEDFWRMDLPESEQTKAIWALYRRNVDYVIGVRPVTAEQAVTTLTAEGHDRADVVAAIDSLIVAGLELPQPDEGTVISDAEMQVLRDQLAS
ncbi:hypothetical protein [Saccharopolyspora pogona]|uniref:hypothetical protein n=1 Tax=Saccharopolyspora pogona TaxID=333966 RepID=UPI0016868AF7|nr:hypothetical protein [Saccharopolyspora pogona]